MIVYHKGVGTVGILGARTPFSKYFNSPSTFNCIAIPNIAHSYNIMQILMNALLARIIVTLMPHVPTPLGASPVLVTKDTVEMELSAMV